MIFSFKTISPSHRFSFHSTVRIKAFNLFQFRLLPIRNFLNSSIRIIMHFCNRRGTTFLMIQCFQIKQIIIQTKYIGTTFIIDNSRMISSTPLCWTHNISFCTPWSGSFVAHGIANPFRTTS